MSRLTSELFEITELAHHGPEDIFISGVTIIGAPYLSSGVSTTASNLLSRNVADVLAHFVRDGKLAIDLNEELDNAMVVAGRGEEAKKEEE